MIGNPINIAGIEMPSSNPLFLTLIAFHVLFALVCVVSGVPAMLSKKRAGLHPASGRIYYWTLLAVFASASLLSTIRWAEDYHLFVIGLFSFASATAGRLSIHRRQGGRLRLHIVGMGLSYILMLTAFYVDNGKSLPVWRDLPAITYWLLPGVVGTPLIVRALLKHADGRQPAPQQREKDA